MFDLTLYDAHKQGLIKSHTIVITKQKGVSDNWFSIVGRKRRSVFFLIGEFKLTKSTDPASLEPFLPSDVNSVSLTTKEEICRFLKEMYHVIADVRLYVELCGGQ